MKWYCFPVLGLAAIVGLSCGRENAPPSANADPAPSLQENRSTAGQGAQATAREQRPTRVAINIPDGARWTIFCASYSDPLHVSTAKAMKDYLLRTTSMRDWYIVQSELSTTLYYGYYKEIDERADKKDGPRAQADRRAVSNLTDPRSGDRLFHSVLLMPLDEPDPSAPTQWDLRQAKGYWSLQIAAFKDSTDRKERAVEAARALRADGQEAYYYHGPTISLVCIGAFAKEAAVREGFVSTDPSADVDVMVLPSNMPAPKGEIIGPDGHRVIAANPTLKIFDERLRKLMQQYPHNAVNGVDGKMITTRTGEKVPVYQSSLLVPIPHDEQANQVAGPGALPAPAPADASLAVPIDPWRAQRITRPAANSGNTQPQGGKLRSLDQ
jgi:hypothetical protein